MNESTISRRGLFTGGLAGLLPRPPAKHRATPEAVDAPERAPAWQELGFEGLPRLDALLQPVVDEVLERTAITAGQRLLSVGAGSLPFEAARRGALVTAVDTGQGLLAHRRTEAQAAGVPAGFRLTRPRSLAFDDGTFEASASMFDDMVAQRATRIVADMFRVTNRGGMVVVAVWEPNEFLDEVSALLAADRAAVPGGSGAGARLDVVTPHFAALADHFDERSTSVSMPIESPQQLLDDLLLPGAPLAGARPLADEGLREANAAKAFDIARSHSSGSDGEPTVELPCRVLSGRRP